MDFWERLSRLSLYLDGTDKTLEMDRSQVEQFYLPLAERSISCLANRSRLLIGVAGPPGCGKSAFSTLLAAVINAQAGQELACVVGMDGWHFPNSFLTSHSIEREGKPVSLRSIKGAPETFDVQALLRCLAAIREGGAVSYPVYSRRLHEAQPEGGQVREEHQIVIVEGNYLFLDEAPWNVIRSMFDVQIFLKASLEAIQASLMERHLRGGKSLDFVDRHIYEVDLPNAQRVLMGSTQGSIIVDKLDARLIRSVVVLEEQPGTMGSCQKSM